jgi:dihydroorotase
VTATVTVHHLCLTLDDVLGGELKPHHFCKPVAKRPEDLAALRSVVFGGNRKFFLGTDSAPHLRGAKECSSGCAGVFTAPVAMPILTELFEAHGGTDWVRNLERFTSVFGAQFYGLPVNEGQLRLIRSPWRVAEELAGVVPFRAGEELQWQVG